MQTEQKLGLEACWFHTKSTVCLQSPPKAPHISQPALLWLSGIEVAAELLHQSRFLEVLCPFSSQARVE